MISAEAQRMQEAQTNAAGSPSVLRLLMLEARHELDRRDLSDESRADARALVEGLRNAIARSPSLSFVDVAAKLQIAETQTPDHDMIRSAMEDLRRLRAEIRHA